MSQSDLKIVAVAVVIFLGVCIYRLVQRFRRLIPTADPWSDDVQASVCDENAVPVCHRCFTGQEPNTLFCPKCGTAVGDYNNILPWVQVFSEGEVLRNSLFDRVRVNVLTIVGFFVFTVALGCLTGIGLMLMPFLWVMFVKNIVRSRSLEAVEKISNGNETSL
ncbi:MAG: hypothetical protein JWO95_100 [Verrucomicrobiales bacterium]|nr:hypothetical protein [Verrucomicrobiales bacterium]